MRLFVFCCKMLCSTRLWKSSHSVFSPRASALLHMPIYPNSQCPPPPQFLLSLLACSHPLSFPAAPSSSPSLPSSILLSQCQVPSLTYQLFSPILHPLPSEFPSSSLQVVTPFCLLFLLGCSHFLVFHLAHPLSLAVSTPSIHVPIPFPPSSHLLLSYFSCIYPPPVPSPFTTVFPTPYLPHSLSP